jgi:hypothetical protein
MNTRSFDWRDLPVLLRYRDNHTYLNSALLLTQGPRSIIGAFLSSISQAIGIITSICPSDNNSGPPVIGQAIHVAGSQAGQLTFMAPAEALDSSAVPAVLEHLSAQVGERGAFRLLADVDERSLAFEALRRASFAIYARQRIWQIKSPSSRPQKKLPWKVANDRDLIAIRSLYYNIVPGLVQQVEPLNGEHLRGLVCRQGDDLLAFVELRHGVRGIWAQPFVHPDAEEVTGHFVDLIQNLPYRHSRPVYLCIRSYQSWLEAAVEELGAEPGPRQAVMVKHLALAQKAARSFTLPALESGHPEISAPVVHVERT